MPPEPLELGEPTGWLREGRPWRPAAPFYAVLGDPIAHSLSPALQGAALRARGLPHAYLAVRIPGGRLARLRDGAWDPRLAGFNVTAPLKIEAATLCDELTAAAARAGAVNTVRVVGGRWTGHNTDVGGIARVLARRWPAAARPEAGIVLGTGGSARAAVLGLLEWGVGRIAVRCRSAESGRSFRAWLEGCGAPGANAVAVEPLELREAREVLEATGVPGESAVWIVCLAAGVPAPVPQPRAAASLVLELRYGSALPPTSGDVPVVDGREVLLAQGGLSFAWWFGEPVPWEQMHAAL